MKKYYTMDGALMTPKPGFHFSECKNGALGIFENDTGQFIDWQCGPNEWTFKYYLENG